MNTLCDLLARERRSDHPALRVPGDPAREYDYHRLLTNAWKTGNFLHHCGVRRGRAVAVVGRTPESVLTFLGTALLGGETRFDPPRTVSTRALVASIENIAEYDLPPGGQYVAYGGQPENPKTTHFEREVWSENPTLPPADISPTDTALTTGERSFTHADLLNAANSVVEETEMNADAEISLRAPLREPGTVAAGIVAPLCAGATVLLGNEVGDIAVTLADGAQEESAIDVSTLF
ncbi:MAG TPA: hypothetical protein VFJ06_10570 [Halococcus sp.]|nr:hypothetical protein [Halococcus sp.]